MMDFRNKAISHQNEIIAQAILYFKGTNDDFCIIGAAGVGKSHTVKKLLESVARPKDKILITTLAHEALRVSVDFMDGSKLKFSSATIASATNSRPITDDDGNISFVPQKRYKKVKGKMVFSPPMMSEADIIIIDECSQVSHNQMLMFERLRKPNSRIIYVGDIIQLPPIERNEGELFSPVFQLKTFELIYPFRYGGEMMEIGDVFRAEIKKGLTKQTFNPRIWEQFIGQNFKSFAITNSDGTFGNTMMDSFRKDPLGTKYISYTQYSYKKTGEWVAQQLSGSPNKFEVGEFITSKSNYYKDNMPIMNNGQNGMLTGKRMMKMGIVWLKGIRGNWQFYKIEDTKYSSPVNLKLKYCETLDLEETHVKVEEIEFWSHDIDDKRLIPTIVKNKKRYGEILEYLSKPDSCSPISEYEKHWDAKNAMINFFCEIQYAYAQTSHTAQGRTYESVFPSLKDIYSVEKTSGLEKLQSAYVSITRAKNKTLCLI